MYTQSRTATRAVSLLTFSNQSKELEEHYSTGFLFEESLGERRSS
jgi:hypothetical protein